MKEAEEAERSLLAELKRIQDAPVTAVELEKAKNQLITNELRERETSEGKSFALAQAAVLLGDAAQVNSGIGKLQAVTSADVQRVMKKYFNDKNRVVITYQAERRSHKQAVPMSEREKANEQTTDHLRTSCVASIDALLALPSLN